MSKEKENKEKFSWKFFFGVVSFFANVLTIFGVIYNFYDIKELRSQILLNQKQKQSQVLNSTNYIGDVKKKDVEKRVLGEELSDIVDESNFSNWDDPMRAFEYDGDTGFYCIKNKKKYNFGYYFLWKKSPIEIDREVKIRIRAKNNKNISTENNSIVLAYKKNKQDEDVYRMFFPATESNLVGFDVDRPNGESIKLEPRNLRAFFDIYRDDFTINYRVMPIQDTNLVHFKYNLSFLSSDEYNEQIDSSNFFEQELSVRPEDLKPFVFGIGVRRDGPCFSIESFY